MNKHHCLLSLLLIANLAACDKKSDAAPSKAGAVADEPAKKPASKPAAAPAPATPAAPTGPVAVLASCMHPEQHTCTDYIDPSAPVDVAKSICEAGNGKLAMGVACPAAKRFGQCAKEAMGTHVSYYPGVDGSHTLALSQERCEKTGGTWQP